MSFQIPCKASVPSSSTSLSVYHGVDLRHMPFCVDIMMSALRHMPVCMGIMMSALRHMTFCMYIMIPVLRHVSVYMDVVMKAPRHMPVLSASCHDDNRLTSDTVGKSQKCLFCKSCLGYGVSSLGMVQQ